ncbi:MAG TPA: SMP-30/gluconolactonase/LRE family protein [Polyangia bacterium]|nr:SMP-30/gluconolactonase/LRE family protein [Polyangia bacterium]
MRQMTTMMLGATLAMAPAIAAAAGGIEYKAPVAYPEGVAHDAKTGEFFVSSMRKGIIGAVKADGQGKGTYREFAKDPLLVSAVGMHADGERGRLLVCVSDPGVSLKTSPKTQKKLARLMAFDLKTGKRKSTVDLNTVGGDGPHFCNDMAVDSEGNVFVTDSFSPVIYRVDGAFKATVFAKDDKFKGEGFGLNGIVHHKDGFLIVANSSNGTLWKVSEKEPAKIEEIALTEKLPDADGLVLTAAGELVVVQNTAARVTQLKSTDGWKTAKATKSVSTDKVFPTTAVEADGKIYVNLSHLNELFADPKKAKTETFSLTEVVF